MKTLDITYDENYFKEQDQKSDKAFNAQMKAVSYLILLSIIYALLYFFGAYDSKYNDSDLH